MARRAPARCISAEMHAGFVALRTAMPMNLKLRFRGRAAGVGACRGWVSVFSVRSIMRTSGGDPIQPFKPSGVLGLFSETSSRPTQLPIHAKYAKLDFEAGLPIRVADKRDCRYHSGSDILNRYTLIPSGTNLPSILDSLLRSGDAVLAARAENYRFEERVGSARQAHYETSFAPAGGAYDEWLDSHANYLNTAIYAELPETFTATNQDAALPAAVSSALGQEQFLIRVESLDYALGDLGLSLPDLEHSLATYGGRPDPSVAAGDAKALLQKVCDSLNRNPNAVRPRFAAFAQELEADIAAPDWATRLRDRLGLAHLPPTGTYGPHPVILMRYKVREVTGRAKTLNADFPLAGPSVLDAEPYEIFHPSPKELNYGRTLNLAGAGDCDQLASEVLHLRIDYSPGHIWKVGAITGRADVSPPRLTVLRSDHLVCLQLQSNRDDFGVL